VWIWSSKSAEELEVNKPFGLLEPKATDFRDTGEGEPTILLIIRLSSRGRVRDLVFM
jgi:hypothetical protein